MAHRKDVSSGAVCLRRSVFVEGISEREASRRFGLARETVRKMLRYAVPPGYRRQQPEATETRSLYRHHRSDSRSRCNATPRIFERLRDEHDFSGGYTIVKDYVREKKLGQQEMFVPLEHAPGDAQADGIGEAWVEIAGVESKAHYLVIDLPQSDDAFVQAFPAERAKRSAKVTTKRSVTSAAYRGASSTTTRIGGADPGRRTAPENKSFQRAAVALLVRGSFRATGRQRQGEGGGAGGLCAASRSRAFPVGKR